MPAVSSSQRRLFQLADHNPSALFKANKSLANLPKSTLHEFASTKGPLPKKVKPKGTISSMMKKKSKPQGDMIA